MTRGEVTHRTPERDTELGSSQGRENPLLCARQQTQRSVVPRVKLDCQRISRYDMWKDGWYPSNKYPPAIWQKYNQHASVLIIHLTRSGML